MKVLHVLDHSLPLHSGYVFRTQGILSEQRKAGIETFHVTGAKHPDGHHESEVVGEFEFFRTPLAPSALDRLPAVDQLRVITSLRRRAAGLLDALRPDVVHAHSPCLNALAVLHVAHARKLPVVYELRASWEDAAVSHGSTKEGSLRYRLSRALEDQALRRADHVVTICEGLKEDCIARGIEREKITVVANAVDRSLLTTLCELDAASRPRPNRDRPTIGFFGSFYDYEGLELLIDAMADLRARHPSARLLLLGSGPCGEALRSQVSALALDDRVQFTGRVPHEEVAAHYRDVDVFVFPRKPMRLTEIVTPLKPLEAMAAGALVVASDVGGHRELIEDEQTGLLFAAGLRTALTGALDRALSDPTCCADIRERGRAWVLAERTWPAIARAYGPIYEALCA